MGMFNEVNFSMKCPVCATEIDGFQTKDGSRLLENVEPESINNFYASCDNCYRTGVNTWIEYSRTPKEMTHREKKLSEEEIIAMGFVLEVTSRNMPLL